MKRERPMPGYYGILPANVRYDRKLSSSSKILYTEISALCTKEGYCWATNQYFADLYDVTPRAIQMQLDKLFIRKYIRMEYSLKGGLRKIFLLSEQENIGSVGDEINFVGETKNSSPPDEENIIHSSKEINKESKVSNSSSSGKETGLDLESIFETPFPDGDDYDDYSLSDNYYDTTLNEYDDILPDDVVNAESNEETALEQTEMRIGGRKVNTTTKQSMSKINNPFVDTGNRLKEIVISSPEYPELNRDYGLKLNIEKELISFEQYNSGKIVPDNNVMPLFKRWLQQANSYLEKYPSRNSKIVNTIPVVNIDSKNRKEKKLAQLYTELKSYVKVDPSLNYESFCSMIADLDVKYGLKACHEPWIKLYEIKGVDTPGLTREYILNYIKKYFDEMELPF